MKYEVVSKAAEYPSINFRPNHIRISYHITSQPIALVSHTHPSAPVNIPSIETRLINVIIIIIGKVNLILVLRILVHFHFHIAILHVIFFFYVAPSLLHPVPDNSLQCTATSPLGNHSDPRLDRHSLRCRRRLPSQLRGQDSACRRPCETFRMLLLRDRLRWAGVREAVLFLLAEHSLGQSR